MTDLPSPDHPFRISTAAFPEPKRLSAWREIYGRNIAQFEIEPLDDVPFHADVTFQQLSGIGFAQGSRSDSNYRMTPLLATRARDNVIFAVVTQGTGFVSQFGREITVGAGCAMLISGNDPSACALRDHGRFLTLSLPRDSFVPMIADPNRAFVKAIPAETMALRHLVEYLGIVHTDFESASTDHRRLIAHHITDLAALAVGATRETTELSHGRGLRVARMLAIRREIDRRFADPELNLPALANQIGVTPRYVQSLLAESNTSFVDEVMQRRLTRAHEMLSSPLYNRMTIIDLAYHCGFASVSNFYRAFRQAFESTPSSVRAQTFDRAMSGHKRL